MLDKVSSDSSKKKILGLVKNWSILPIRDKLWVSGFLKWSGYLENEILQFLCKFGANREITRQNLDSLFNNSNKRERYPQNNNKPKKIIEEIHQDDISERFARIPADDLNKELFRDSFVISTGYLNPVSKKESHSIYPPMYSYTPTENSYFCSIQKTNSTLLVLDYDRKDFGGSLERTWQHAKKIFLKQHGFTFWDHFKFSGSEGYHLIKQVPKCSAEQLIIMARMIDESDMYDVAMFQPNRRIRGYNINLKSGLMSVPVQSNMMLNEILKEGKIKWKHY